MRDGTYFKPLKPSDLVHRWHGTASITILESRDSVTLGDIIDDREVLSEVAPPYAARIRSNFANTPSLFERYYFGTTHVAVGFNDFSGLLSATLSEDSNDEVGPLRFVGFEMSEFAVAKCKVVALMLGSPNVAITSVMEVWLSSTWSETTLKDFCKSVNAVLASLHGRDENPKVMSYLRHWASAETISAAKARSEFFLNLERYNKKQLVSLCCFRREVDRVDLAQYMLSGEIRATPNVMVLVEAERNDEANAAMGASEASDTAVKKKRNRKKKKAQQLAAAASSITPLVGSLTMWNMPLNAPPLEEDIAFNTVDFMSLLEEYVERQKTQKSTAERLSVVDYFVIHILRNLHRLRDLMVADKLTIDIIYGVVKAVRRETMDDEENQELLARIAMMRPYTISWSNVLDYFLPEDFHDLARRCSLHGDCVHYGYSMNWPTQVYGASIMDFEAEHDKEFIGEILDTTLGFPNKQRAPSASSFDAFKMMGLDKLVLLPIREHPLNGTGYVLAHVFKDNWIRHFMAKGRLTAQSKRRLGTLCAPTNSGLQQGAMDLAMPSSLYRTSLTMYLSWCYDPELRLQAAHNPFELGAATDKDLLADLLKHMSAAEKQQFWADIETGY